MSDIIVDTEMFNNSIRGGGSGESYYSQTSRGIYWMENGTPKYINDGIIVINSNVILDLTSNNSFTFTQDRGETRNINENHNYTYTFENKICIKNGGTLTIKINLTPNNDITINFNAITSIGSGNNNEDLLIEEGGKLIFDGITINQNNDNKCGSNIHINFNSYEIQNNGKIYFKFKNLKKYSFDNNLILDSDDNINQIKSTSYVWFGCNKITNIGDIYSNINFIIKPENNTIDTTENTFLQSRGNSIFNNVIENNVIQITDYQKLLKYEKSPLYSGDILFQNSGTIELETEFTDSNSKSQDINNNLYFVSYYLIFENNGIIKTPETKKYNVYFYFYSVLYNKNTIQCLGKDIIYQVLKPYKTIITKDQDGNETNTYYQMFSLIVNLGNIKCNEITRSLFNLTAGGPLNYLIEDKNHEKNGKYYVCEKIINYSNIEVSKFNFVNSYSMNIFLNNFGNIKTESFILLVIEFINNGCIQLKNINSNNELTFEYYFIEENYDLSEYLSVDQKEGLYRIQNNINYGIYLYDDIILNKYCNNQNSNYLNFINKNITDNLKNQSAIYNLKLKQSFFTMKNLNNYKLDNFVAKPCMLSIKNNFGISWNVENNLYFNCQMLFDNDMYLILNVENISKISDTDIKILCFDQIKIKKDVKFYLYIVNDNNTTRQIIPIITSLSQLFKCENRYSGNAIFLKEGDKDYYLLNSFSSSTEYYDEYIIYNNCYFYFSSSNKSKDIDMTKIIPENQINKTKTEVYNAILKDFDYKLKYDSLTTEEYNRMLHLQFERLFDMKFSEINSTDSKWPATAINKYISSKAEEKENALKDAYNSTLSSFGSDEILDGQLIDGTPATDSKTEYIELLKQKLGSLLELDSDSIDTTVNKWGEKAIDDYKESKIKEIEDLKKQLKELQDKKDNTSNSGEIQVLNDQIQNLINQIDSLTMKINKLAFVTIMGMGK